MSGGLCKDFEGGEAHNSVMEDIDDCDALVGFFVMVSAAIYVIDCIVCHL